jgi:hypothetical protein
MDLLAATVLNYYYKKVDSEIIDTEPGKDPKKLLENTNLTMKGLNYNLSSLLNNIGSPNQIVIKTGP